MTRVHAVLPVAALFAVLSCRGPIETPVTHAGVYALRSIDAQLLPTGVPCGGFTALEGAIVLRSDRTASYSLRYVEKGTGKEITYSAAGSFVEARSNVDLNLWGGWSNDTTRHAHSVRLRVSDGVLFRDGIGAECDGNSTESYVLVR